MFCPRMPNGIAASLHSEMQNSFGNCLTEMENKVGHAEFYLCLGRHSLHAKLKDCGWSDNKVDQSKGFTTSFPSPLHSSHLQSDMPAWFEHGISSSFMAFLFLKREERDGKKSLPMYCNINA